MCCRFVRSERLKAGNNLRFPVDWDVEDMIAAQRVRLNDGRNLRKGKRRRETQRCAHIYIA